VSNGIPGRGKEKEVMEQEMNRRYFPLTRGIVLFAVLIAAAFSFSGCESECEICGHENRRKPE